MPHASTNKTPAEMFLNRKISTRLDLMIPQNSNLNTHYDTIENVKTFACGERVACRNYSGGEKWKFGVVSARKGKLHYTIHLDDGRSWERHVNQMRKIGKDTPTTCLENDHYYWDSEQSREPVRSNSPVTLDTENSPEVLEKVAPVSSQTNQDVNRETILETQRRSARTKRRPDFFSERTEK
ncbi:uncharacterized protein LOC114938586 [Nylanderia fulva]|uniref:uncharacterized protein LOC114938586 n=1 Tax=Nylanderia fulva TaxID=613905 RepID=UPI0010FAD4CB|nr:uncharacterized protein LOC114938586 [Nylanderia fulva]